MKVYLIWQHNPEFVCDELKAIYKDREKAEGALSSYGNINSCPPFIEEREVI